MFQISGTATVNSIFDMMDSYINVWGIPEGKFFFQEFPMLNKTCGFFFTFLAKAQSNEKCEVECTF